MKRGIGIVRFFLILSISMAPLIGLCDDLVDRTFRRIKEQREADRAAQLALDALGKLNRQTPGDCASCRTTGSPLATAAAFNKGSPSLRVNQGGPAANAPGNAATNPAVFDDIKKIVDGHQDCLNADAGKGKKVGAVKGFVYGTAMAFAGTVCRPDNDPVRQAITQGGDADVLQLYGGELGIGGAMQSNDGIGQASMGSGQFAQGEKAIVATYMMLLAHAQWESSGNFTEGKDVAGQVQTPDGAEAGAWQVSWDFRGKLSQAGQQGLKSLIDAYQNQVSQGSQAPPESLMTKASFSTGGGGAPQPCFAEVFSDGIQKVDTRPYEGSGEAANFQRLNRECPRFSAEINAMGIRHNVSHYGPLKRKEVVAPVQCQRMLEEVAAKAKSGCGSLKPPVGASTPMS